MKKKIVTFGELLLRFSKPDHLRLTQGDMFTSKYGGSEANVAVSLASQG
jgi:2-dehydro-3-deoxygluconokinase